MNAAVSDNTSSKQNIKHHCLSFNQSYEIDSELKGHQFGWTNNPIKCIEFYLVRNI